MSTRCVFPRRPSPRLIPLLVPGALCAVVFALPARADFSPPPESPYRSTDPNRHESALGDERDAERDSRLRLLNGDHLFPANVTRIAVRRGHYLRGFAYRFIELCSPELTQGVIQSGIAPRISDELGV